MIVALMGPAGAGKSTVSNHLVEKYGAVKYSLAGPLKLFAQAIFKFSDDQLYGTQAQKEAPDPRYGGRSCRWVLQKLGTEGGRNTFGKDFWTKMCVEKIDRDSMRGPLLAVIDDARFVNEAALIMGREKFAPRVGVLHACGELIKNAFEADPVAGTCTIPGMDVHSLYIRTFNAGRLVFGRDFWDRMEKDEAPRASTVPGYVVKLYPVGKMSSDDGTHASEAEWKLAPHNFEISPELFGVEHLYRHADEVMDLIAKEQN